MDTYRIVSAELGQYTESERRVFQEDSGYELDDWKNAKGKVAIMKATLIIALLTLLRLGIPLVILLSIGEFVRRHVQGASRTRGA